MADSLGTPVQDRGWDGSIKSGPILLVTCNPYIATVNQRGPLGNREADACAGGPIGVGGGTIVSVEDALAVREGNDRAEAVHREDQLLAGLNGADGDGGAKIQHLHALSMYCVSSMTIN